MTEARPTSEPVPAVVGTATIGAMPSMLARVHQSPTSSKSQTGRRLAGHEGNAFAEIKARAAAKGDDAVMTAILEGLDAGIKIDFSFGLRIDIGEHRPAKAGGVENIERILGDRHRRQATVGDQQRLLHAERLAVIGEFLDAPGPELDRRSGSSSWQ